MTARNCGKFRLAALLGLGAFILARPGRAEIRTSWEYIYPDGEAIGYGIAVTPQRNLFVVGSLYENQVGSSQSWPLVVRLSSYGAPSWATTFSGSGSSGVENAARAIALHPSGDLVVAGQVWSGTSADGWVARITQAGAIVWELTIDGSLSQADAFEGVAVNQSTGEIYAVGRQTRCSPNAQLWVVRLDEDGGGEMRLYACA